MKHQILNDCRKTMLNSTLIYIAAQLTENLLLLYISLRLGNFTDIVVNKTVSNTANVIPAFVLCIFIAVIIIPLLNLAGDTVMLKNSLKHDKIVLEHFIDKTYESAMKLNEGDVKYRLENDAIELRSCLQDIHVNIIVTIITSLYFFICIFKANIIYGLVTCLLSAFRLLIPTLVQERNAKYDEAIREYKTAAKIYENLLTSHTCDIKLNCFDDKIINKFNTFFYKNFNTIQKKQIFCQLSCYVN